MRDPKRIDKFCDELKTIWHCVPDWRFGQLMSNMLGAYVTEKKRDIFFPEEDELMEFFKKYIGENKPVLPCEILDYKETLSAEFVNNVISSLDKLKRIRPESKIIIETKSV